MVKEVLKTSPSFCYGRLVANGHPPHRQMGRRHLHKPIGSPPEWFKMLTPVNEVLEDINRLPNRQVNNNQRIFERLRVDR